MMIETVFFLDKNYSHKHTHTRNDDEHDDDKNNKRYIIRIRKQKKNLMTCWTGTK